MLNYPFSTRLDCFKVEQPTSSDVISQRISDRRSKRNAHANERRRPSFKTRFKTGDVVKLKTGRLVTLAEQVSAYTFKTTDGVKVNVRNLILHARS